MMQILVSVLIEQKVEGKPFTYNDMVGDTAGFDEACSEVVRSTSKSHQAGHDPLMVAEKVDIAKMWLMRLCVDFGDTALQFVGEVQLHLQFYLDARKDVHHWLKLSRANSLSSMKQDCAQYYDAEFLLEGELQPTMVARTQDRLRSKAGDEVPTYTADAALQLSNEECLALNEIRVSELDLSATAFVALQQSDYSDIWNPTVTLIQQFAGMISFRKQHHNANDQLTTYHGRRCGVNMLYSDTISNPCPNIVLGKLII